MSVWIWLFILVVILQRIIELFIAKQNEIWMKGRGGVEKGEKHYKWFILLHCFFFLSMMTEVVVDGTSNMNFSYFWFSVFLLTQMCRIWCIQSLGRFWNTKVIILPGVALIRKGPYKYVKHPNYIIVAIELFVIPFMIGAQVTAVIFPILHIMLLRVRIPREEKALRNAAT
ncbi:isoprenylcysteine carboxyl methyltransferase family protein [Virgibacillus siamensis]|uniref:isoprenylcysteine carboxyl methyltransferase family protein n=1 Tax=Virgibacillus siamensis TaxID=480071 RepID=UPI0009846DE7|nr:isoprenylcysteine carboxylmethyltransferase family protein [Virgibacillus siamensis]